MAERKYEEEAWASELAAWLAILSSVSPEGSIGRDAALPRLLCGMQLRFFLLQLEQPVRKQQQIQNVNRPGRKVSAIEIHVRVDAMRWRRRELHKKHPRQGHHRGRTDAGAADVDCADLL